MKSVQARYTKGAQKREEALCCPVLYNPEYLKIIPKEVIERDYGCGDPSRYVKEGETVLDLGSGGGKICFIAAQIVGKKGKVFGVDMTPEMLDLAKKSQGAVEKKMGYSNIEFLHGHIQDLSLNFDLVEKYLQKHPVQNVSDLEKLEEEKRKLRKKSPLIPDNSIDIIVSNCVLNLVSDTEKRKLFSEMFRVLKKGGRIAISDIVSDEESPEHLKNDDSLWSGCISGALQESEFIELLEEAGFYGIALDKYDKTPWRIVEGIEYRSVTITAYKGKEGKCVEKNQAVIYKGPWKTVTDDDGHTLFRGKRMAVCEKTFDIYTKSPYSSDIIPVPSQIPVQKNEEFNCSRNAFRTPQETKKGVKRITSEPSSCEGSCC